MGHLKNFCSIFQSAADICGKFGVGDEVVKVNDQVVVSACLRCICVGDEVVKVND